MDAKTRRALRAIDKTLDSLHRLPLANTLLVQLRPRFDSAYISQGRTVLETAVNGFIPQNSPHGLFVHETRILSRYEFRINGLEPTAAALSNVEQHSSLGYYVLSPPGFVAGEPDKGSGQMGDTLQNTLELRLSRYVGEGMHEDVDLTNFTQNPTSFELQLLVDADFASVAETVGKRQQQGEIVQAWEPRDGAGRLAFHYVVQHSCEHQDERGTAFLRRGVYVAVERAQSTPRWTNQSIVFPVRLEAQGTWHACIHVIPIVNEKELTPLYGCRSFLHADNSYEQRRRSSLEVATIFETPNSGTLTPVVVGALERAKRDLSSLRLFDLDASIDAWTVAAGLPVFIALFGRDTLTTAWQAALLSADLMKGTLPILAELQGTQCNDWRDEQPGRMLHEAHTDPLSVLNYTPRLRYYGATTTSGFYSLVVSALWHWTGDKSIVAPFIEPALKALHWLDTYCDSNGDGFYDYQTRSQMGTKNQGWKDSGDAIVYEDGRQVEPNCASCEEQGFVYIAKLHLSEVLWWLGRKDEARKLYREAAEFKKRFNDKFWMENEGFFAMGLDAQSRQVRSIGSDPGHCVTTGIVDDALVPRVVQRMMKDDLFSGWGIRTLSSAHPAYNPYSYHRGSVWPVENGTFAVGFVRYGLLQAMEKICRAQFEAAALFPFCRLPELFAGHPRDADHPFPALYPQANWPQAWSASAIFSFVQAMLGLYPYAPLKLLLVDPQLPPWLPEITLRNLHIGKAVVAIRFYRKDNGASDYEVLDKRGRVHVLRQPSPWSLTASYAERVKDVLTSFLPGE